MRSFGEFKLFTKYSYIEEIRSMEPPTSDYVRTHPNTSHMTKGFAVAIWNRNLNEFEILGSRIKVEDAIESIKIRRDCCNKFPEIFGNWYTDYSDMYLFETAGYTKPNWGLCGILVEE